MKNLRFVTLLVFMICAFCLPAQAQQKWTYKANNAVPGSSFHEEITIIITRRPNGYEVSGEYIGSTGVLCKIRGSYHPSYKTEQLRATCAMGLVGDWEITGSKLSGKDAFQVSTEMGGTLVAKRVGATSKPTESNTGGEPKRNCDPAMFNRILGTWQSEFGPVTLNGSCDKITGYWQQDASNRGEITGGSFDSDTRKLTISYKQSWNNVTDGRAVFTLTPDGKLDGTYNGGGGNGIWTLHK